MKTDVTYGFVSGAIFIYVYATPENSTDKKYLEEYQKAVQGMLDFKLKGDNKELTDDHSLLGINYTSKIDNNIQRIIKRVVKTACTEFEVNFKLKIHKVEE